jgi:uncharacterized membrane protein
MLLLNIILALSILGISYAFKKFCPDKINDFVGYRTKRSMSSQEAWDLANRYSSDTLFKCAIWVVMFQLMAMFILPKVIVLLITVSIWIAVLIGTIIMTEQKLKKKF